MGNHKISTDLKEIALQLWEAGWERTDIAQAFGISQTSLYQWKKLFELTGSAANLLSPIRGHPQIIGMVAFNTLKQIYCDDPGVMLLVQQRQPNHFSEQLLKFRDPLVLALTQV
ncbi:hypothetical protein Moror_4915 [Moniliophthora roreri MCA 2997]|uniref:Insertion element IS150 protein InsJ-like helix-turn-helix domain-containing protein n=2 Tax=Moniliophthora roreri TaxID=221103 RepID=V2W9I3_MONRO|nr:hypothetical protein Moror_4915 [Moniliophthora roreri MCA 2997]